MTGPAVSFSHAINFGLPIMSCPADNLSRDHGWSQNQFSPAVNFAVVIMDGPTINFGPAS